MSTVKANAFVDGAGGNTATINGITPALASQAEAQAGTDNTKIMTPLRLRDALNATGSAPTYACRAWVCFDGSVAAASMIKASGNISSITDNGTGDYTLNFATALPDANYAIAGMGVGLSATNITGGNAITLQGSATAYLPNLKTATQARIMIGNSTNGVVADVQDISLVVFR